MKLKSRHWLLGGAAAFFAVGVGCSSEDPGSPRDENLDSTGDQPDYPSDGGASSGWEQPEDPHQQPDEGHGGDSNGNGDGAGGGAGDDGGACTGDELLETTLSGSEEVPPADPDGSGSALLTLSCEHSELCFDLTVENVAPVTAAHIHEAVAGTNGPVLLNLGVRSDENEVCPLNKPVPVLTASDGAAGNAFGRALALEGGTALIGADNAAYVFKANDNAWDETQKLTCMRPDFGLAVALSGSHAAVSSADAVNIYDIVDGVFVEVQKLTPPDADAQDFGAALAMSGDTLLVGAPNDVLASNNFGSVYVFERSGSTWSETARLRPGINLDGFSCFGCALALRGDLALVGAPQAFPNDPGATFSFERQGSVWVAGPDFPAPTTPGGLLGTAVAISSSTVLLGAPGEFVFDGPFLIGLGAAHPFGRVGAEWVPEGVAPSFRSPQNALLPEIVGDDTDFGAAVATSGDIAVVGAPGANAAHLFTRSAGVWTEDDVLELPDGDLGDLFGTTVAVAGNTIMVGAPDATTTEGAVFVYGPEGDSNRACNVAKQEFEACIGVHPDTLNAISQNPEQYYVNVHTQDFPDGAVRGQLGD
ncbi:MAG TPA: CHRD domain-containing protein [Polyangiaceae bacterium]|nr:CHRD domain-containing protein [Polyangiaceae bacterium]